MRKYLVPLILGGAAGAILLRAHAERAAWGLSSLSVLVAAAGLLVLAWSLVPRESLRRFVAGALAVLSIGYLSGQTLSFIPGDRGIPSEAWSNWHGLAPANKYKPYNITFTGATDSTIVFPFMCDYVKYWVEAADCSLAAYVGPTSNYAASFSIDSTSYKYAPQDQVDVLTYSAKGLKLKGMGGGRLHLDVYGRTY